MNLLVLDFETFFDRKDFSLSRLTTESYCRDPRFEAHGCAIKTAADKPAFWVPRPYLKAVFDKIDWANTFAVAHHAQFDFAILNWHYGHLPAMIGDTLAMARHLLGSHHSVSLESVRKHFGIPSKSTPYNLFEGKHWDELSPAVQQMVGAGAVDEVESIWRIFAEFAKTFPHEEYGVVDMIARMFVDPVLRADTKVLSDLWIAEETHKANGLAALGVDESDLQSADRFADLLREEGVEPEMKAGKPHPDGSEKLIYAFAKTDQFMRDLLEDDNPRVRLLAMTRLGVKSTILQTRAESLGWMASRGPLCVYLNYCGAVTLRPTGGDGSNFLNMKRGSPIRKALLAPDGWLLAPIDASQIEFRVGNYLAAGPDAPALQRIRAGGDPYVVTASKFYKREIYKPAKDDPLKAEMEAMRGMGKQGELMCLGPDTEVLTDRGIKRIVDVSTYDRLWDGVEWIEHQGLIFQGVRTVEDFAGVEMTSDHLVLCDPQVWLPAASLRNENILCRALAVGSENLPSQASKWVKKAGWSRLWCNVRAKLPNIPSIPQTSMRAVQHDALLAQENRLGSGSKNITATPMYAQTKSTVPACLGVFQRFTDGATEERNIQISTTTAAGAFLFTNLGATIDVHFLHIWSRCRDGMTQTFQLIASKTTRVIGRAICALQRANSKQQTAEGSGTCKKSSLVFDLNSAGPRHRFTILSERGPLIVHNCIYGAAGKQFKITAKNGTYGPPVEISIEDADAFVRLWREDNSHFTHRVMGYWAQCEEVLKILAGGATLDFGPLLIHMHKIKLPNGAVMNYDTLEWHRPGPDEECRDFERGGYWRMKTRQGWKKMWGSKLTQNICEAVSRVIVSQAMLRIKKQYGFRTLNWPYDELLLLLPRDGHEDKNLELCMAEMRREVTWLSGLPLDCEGSVSERYSK